MHYTTFTYYVNMFLGNYFSELFVCQGEFDNSPTNPYNYPYAKNQKKGGRYANLFL